MPTKATAEKAFMNSFLTEFGGPEIHCDQFIELENFPYAPNWLWIQNYEPILLFSYEIESFIKRIGLIMRIQIRTISQRIREHNQNWMTREKKNMRMWWWSQLWSNFGGNWLISRKYGTDVKKWHLKQKTIERKTFEKKKRKIVAGAA